MPQTIIRHENTQASTIYHQQKKKYEHQKYNTNEITIEQM